MIEEGRDGWMDRLREGRRKRGQKWWVDEWIGG